MDRRSLLALVVAANTLWPLADAAAAVPSGTKIPPPTAQPSPMTAAGLHSRSVGVAPPSNPPALPTAPAQATAAAPGIADSLQTGQPSALAMIVAGLAVIAFNVERWRRTP